MCKLSLSDCKRQCLQLHICARQAAEKVESAKAAAIAGVGGGIASLPYILAAGHSPVGTALSAAVCAASCLLFGVTFRYAIRQDLHNLQLKVWQQHLFQLKGCV